MKLGIALSLVVLVFPSFFFLSILSPRFYFFTLPKVLEGINNQHSSAIGPEVFLESLFSGQEYKNGVDNLSACFLKYIKYLKQYDTR